MSAWIASSLQRVNLFFSCPSVKTPNTPLHDACHYIKQNTVWTEYPVCEKGYTPGLSPSCLQYAPFPTTHVLGICNIINALHWPKTDNFLIFQTSSQDFIVHQGMERRKTVDITYPKTSSKDDIRMRAVWTAWQNWCDWYVMGRAR